MSKKRIYTQEEDKVILSNAEKYSFNLAMSFKKSAEQLNRPLNGVKLRYYAIYKKDKNKCFVTLSKHACLKNMKVCKNEQHFNENKINFKKNIIKKWYLDFIKLFK